MRSLTKNNPRGVGELGLPTATGNTPKHPLVPWITASLRAARLSWIAYLLGLTATSWLRTHPSARLERAGYHTLSQPGCALSATPSRTPRVPSEAGSLNFATL